MFRWLGRLPANHPTGSTITSIALAVIMIFDGIIFGWIAITNPQSATSDQSAPMILVLLGGFFALLGMLVLGLSIYAAVDTQGFKNWKLNDEGKLSHPLPRWFGVIYLFILFFELFIVLLLILTMLNGAIGWIFGIRIKYPWEKS